MNWTKRLEKILSSIKTVKMYGVRIDFGYWVVYKDQHHWLRVGEKLDLGTVKCCCVAGAIALNKEYRRTSRDNPLTFHQVPFDIIASEEIDFYDICFFRQKNADDFMRRLREHIKKPTLNQRRLIDEIKIELGVHENGLEQFT